MTPTVITFIGTYPTAIGLDCLRKIEREARQQERLIAEGSTEQQAAALARLGELVRVHLVAFDVDETLAHSVHPPLRTEILGYPINSFHGTPLPDESMVEHIRDGRHRGRFEHLNPVNYQSLRGALYATAGTPGLGWLTFETNRAKYRGALERAFGQIAGEHHELAADNGPSIRVIVVASTYGGQASGAVQHVERLIRRLAQDMGLNLALYSVLVVPGMNRSKDPDNTSAVTHALLKEKVAVASGRHWHRDFLPGAASRSTVASAPVPTLLVSDTNNAPVARRLEERSLLSFVSEFLLTVALSPVGARVTALLPDFSIPAQEPTATGEPRHGLGAGLATIFFDRELVGWSCELTLGERWLSEQLRGWNEDESALEARAFLEGLRVVEGDGVHDLTDRLLERVPGSAGLFTPARFRTRLQGNLQGLSPEALLEHGVARAELSLQQTGDLEECLKSRALVIHDSIARTLQERTSQLVRDRQAGVMASRQWLERLVLVLDNMSAAAARDNATLEEQVRRFEKPVGQFRSTYLSDLQRRSWFYRWRHRQQIRADVGEFRRSLEQLYLARLRRQAHQAAIELIHELRNGPVAARLQQVQAAVDAVTSERDEAAVERTRLAQHLPHHECPSGLALVQGDEELEGYYRRLLPQGGEAAAINDVHLRLLGDQDPVATLSDGHALRASLRKLTSATFREGLRGLHVVDELMRRYPTPAQLGAVLRERDRESFEAVQLKGSSDHENGVRLIRLLGMDTARQSTVPALLCQYGYARGKEFDIVPTNDPDRIVFCQVRGVFPVSDLAHYEGNLGRYDQLTGGLQSEKPHVSPGERFLPTPGRLLSPVEVRTAVVRAWLLGRIDVDPSGHGPLLLPRITGEAAVTLGNSLEALLGRRGYGLAVDIVSGYCCRYLEKGPEPIREGLARLAGIAHGGATPREAADALVAPLCDVEVLRQLTGELEWWSRSSMPGAMEWGARAASGHTVS